MYNNLIIIDCNLNFQIIRKLKKKMLYKLDIFLYDRFQQRNSTKNNISKLLNERKRFMTIKRDNTPGLYDSSFEHDNCGIGAFHNRT